MSLEQKLSQIKSSIDGRDALMHFQDIFSHLQLSSKTNDIYQKFEDISFQIKNRQNTQFEKTNYEETKQYTEKLQELLIKKVQEGEEAQETGPIGYVPNFIEESRIFEKAGISFGEEENFIIFKSLTKLAQKKATKQLKLWGKILCSEKDYYVAEGIVDGIDDGELQPSVEPRGTGVNKYTYWVCTDLLDEWVDLPIVTPEQIKASREIKYVFTGNLEKKVVTNPHFPGKEKNLLRAQIARISFKSQIVNTGIYKTQDEDPRQIEAIEQDENYKPATFDQLCSLDGWVHICENILKEGRVIHVKPELQEGEEEEVVMKRIETEDPFEPRLKPISKDKSKDGLPEAWTLQIKGDDSTYLTLDGKKEKNNAIILIQSQIWKGLSIVYQDKTQQSLYIGYGFKTNNNLFFPKNPQIMLQEPEDRPEQHEPREEQKQEVQEQKQEEE